MQCIVELFSFPKVLLNSITHSGGHPALVEHIVENGYIIRNALLHLAAIQLALQQAILSSAPFIRKRKLYRGLQLNFTPEIEELFKLFDRCHSKNRTRSIKQNSRYFNFQCKILSWVTLYIEISPDCKPDCKVLPRPRCIYLKSDMRFTVFG